MTRRRGNPKWKKGVSGNPSGRPPVPEDVREARRLNQDELDRVLNRFLQLNRTDLKTILENPESSALELLVGSILTNGIKKGDHMRFDFMLNRMIGKSVDRMEVTNPHMNKSLGELEALVKAKLGLK